MGRNPEGDHKIAILFLSLKRSFFRFASFCCVREVVLESEKGGSFRERAVVLRERSF